MTDTITILAPRVPHGPIGELPEIATAKYLRDAAWKLEKGFPVGGSNVTRTVIDLLRNAASAVESADAAIPPTTQIDYTEYTAWSDFQSPEDWRDVMFIVHVSGPDDVLPARSWAEAAYLAHGVNSGAVDYVSRAVAREGAYVTRAWATPMARPDAEQAGLLEPVV